MLWSLQLLKFLLSSNCTGMDIQVVLHLIGFWIFLIVENLYFWFLWGYAIGGPVPGQGPRDISLDVVWGIVSMFLIIAVVGETISWLVEEVRKLRKTKSRDQSASSRISRDA